MGNLFRLFFISFVISVTASCGGGGSGDGKRPETNTSCSEEDPYCNSKYSEIKIKTRNNQTWLSLTGENSSLQATPQGIIRGETEYTDIHAKEVETWNSSDPSILNVDKNGLITAIAIGEAEITYGLQIDQDLIQTATIKIIVKEDAANLPPIAVINHNSLTVNGGDLITLDGSESYDKDGEIASWEWKVISGQLTNNDIENRSTAIVTFTAPESKYDETIILELVVTDNSGETNNETKSVEIVVLKTLENQLPIFVSSENQEGRSGDKLNLSDPVFNDPDGTLKNFSWSQDMESYPKQPIAEIINAEKDDISITSITLPVVQSETTLHFNFTVTDNDGGQATTQVVINVKPLPVDNERPIARISIDYPDNSAYIDTDKNSTAKDEIVIDIDEETSICFDASASNDPDGKDSATILYQWLITEWPLISTSNKPESPTTSEWCVKTPTITEPTTVKITLNAIETEGEDPLPSAPANITLNVSPVNKKPTANFIIENETPINGYELITLNAATSQDTDENGEGFISEYSWKFIGSSVPLKKDISLTESNNCNDISSCNEVSFYPPVISMPTDLTFSLSVKDNEGSWSDKKTLTITINQFDIAPTNETLMVETDNSATINWNGNGYAGIENIHYIIEASANGNDNWNAITTTVEETATITTPETTAYYRITPVFQDDTPGDSSAVMAFLPSVENLYISDDNRKLKFEWLAVSGAKSYKIDCELENPEGTAYETCYVKCNETDPVGYTSEPVCIHESGSGGGEDIVINEFIEEEKRVISRQYNYSVTPLYNNNSAGASEQLSGYARANKTADLTQGPGVRSYANFAEYNGKLYAFTDHPGTIGALIRFDPETKNRQLVPIIDSMSQILELDFNPISLWPPTITFNDDKTIIYTVYGNNIYSLNISAIDLNTVDNLSDLEWNFFSIDNLNVQYPTSSFIHSNYLFVQNLSQLIIIDLDTKEIKNSISIDANSQPIKVKNYLYRLTIINDIFGFYRADLDSIVNNDDSAWTLFHEITEDIDPSTSPLMLAYDNDHTIYFHGAEKSEYQQILPCLYFLDTDGPENDISKWQKSDIHRPFVDWNTEQIRQMSYSNQKILISGGNEANYEIIDFQNKSWQLFSPEFNPAIKSIAKKYNKEIFLMKSVDDFSYTAQSFDPLTNIWTSKGTIPNTFRINTLIGSSVALDNNIYLMPHGDNHFMKYASGAWQEFSQEMLTIRSGSVSVTDNKLIYLLGGSVTNKDSEGNTTYSLEDGRIIEYFDPTCNQEEGCWQLLTDKQENVVKIPRGRKNHASVFFKGKIYLFGGLDSENNTVREIDIYDTGKEEWQTTTALLPEGTKYYQASVLNNSIIISMIESNGTSRIIRYYPQTYTLELSNDHQFIQPPYYNYFSVKGYSFTTYKGTCFLFGGGTSSWIFAGAALNTINILY